MSRSIHVAALGCSRLPDGWTTGVGDRASEGKCGWLVLIGYLDTLAAGDVMSDAAARCVAEVFRGEDSATSAFLACGAIVGTASALYERLFADTDDTPLMAPVRAATLDYLYSRSRREPVAGWEFLVLT
ncbi:MAG: hypothetical protein ACRD1K_08950 [Acidimicrobiales bacterium]